eukprot:11010682-Lingulodinium_polyedra.AAC.1
MPGRPTSLSRGRTCTLPKRGAKRSRHWLGRLVGGRAKPRPHCLWCWWSRQNPFASGAHGGLCQTWPAPTP